MFHCKTTRLLAGAASALALGAALGLDSRAQTSVSITFGSFNNAAWPAGPDYATDVLGDPWDFNNVEDVSPDPNEAIGWTNFSVNSSAHPGQAGGTTTRTSGGSIDTTMSLIYRGYYGIINPGRNGRRFPIDTSKYAKIAFRMSDSGGGNSPQVYWFHYPWADPRDPSGSGMGVKILGTSVRGNQIYVQDLTQNLTGGMAWANDVVRGLRLDPNAQTVGQDVFFDWVRLTPRDNAAGAAMQTTSWSGGSGNATVTVTDASGTVLTIGSGISGSSLSWNYGILPPGNYTLRVTRSAGVSGQRTFTINAPAVAQPTEPNETGGADYASTVLGNAWDMDSPTDVPEYYNITPSPPSFTGGVLTATNTNGDPSIYVLTNPNNATPIDTSKFRYLTVRFQIDGAFDVGQGSIARLLWSSAQFLNGNTSTTTKDLIVWPGMTSYTIDLATLSTATDGGLEPGGAPELWTSGSKRHLRFDPHEFSTARTFHIDSIKLGAMFETVNGGFTIKWNGSDPDGGDPSVSLYYDTDTNPANGKTLIASGVRLSAGQYFWSAASVPAGVYNIYIETNDGVQTYGRYASGPVRVITGAAAANPQMSIDGPSNGATVVQPFLVSGWALDLGSTSGTGVDAIDVWAFPAGSSAGTYVGAASLFGRRDDVGGVFGAQFTNSGYSLSAAGLAPGTYTLRVAARSTVTGTFNQSRDISITIPGSRPEMALDMPANQTSIGGTFTAAGWALDRSAPSGTGVDYVDLWAWPIHNPDDGFVGSPVFVGRSTGGVYRPDIAAVFGSQFANAGFSLTGTLPNGYFRLVAYAHSVVANAANNQKSSDIAVSGSNPLMSLDSPGDNTTVTQPFAAGGWAIDRGAASGTGVDAVHVWAFPIVDGAVDSAHGIFVAQGTSGGTRADVGAAFGSQFTNSGYTFVIRGLSPGAYQLAVYAHSTVSGTFNNVKFARITVR